MKKKLITFIASFAVLANSFVFASAFDRIFEIKIPVDVDVANNAFALSDVFQDTFEIDFSKLADSLGPEGFTLDVAAKPAPEINLNLKTVHVGLKTGFDFTSSFQFSKELFEFLGKGNANYTDGTILKTSAIINMDAFLSEDIDIIVKNKLFYIGVRPGIFIPLASTSARNINVDITSGDNATFSADIQADMLLRTSFDFSKAVNGQMAKAFDVSEMFSNVGFDMALLGGMNFGRNLTFNGEVKVPVYPGRLSRSTPINANWKYDVSVNDLIKQEVSTPDSPEFTIGDTVKDNSYYINRPLRVFVDASYKPFGDVFALNAGVGLGLRHPFAQDVKESIFYPEYSLGFSVSLLGALKLDVSTSCMEQLFMHKASIGINLRVIEVDAGISSVASTLKASLNGTGLGAHIVVAIGF